MVSHLYAINVFFQSLSSSRIWPFFSSIFFSSHPFHIKTIHCFFFFYMHKHCYYFLSFILYIPKSSLKKVLWYSFIRKKHYHGVYELVGVFSLSSRTPFYSRSLSNNTFSFWLQPWWNLEHWCCRKLFWSHFWLNSSSTQPSFLWHIWSISQKQWHSQHHSRFFSFHFSSICVAFLGFSTGARRKIVESSHWYKCLFSFFSFLF